MTREPRDRDHWPTPRPGAGYEREVIALWRRLAKQLELFEVASGDDDRGAEPDEDAS